MKTRLFRALRPFVGLIIFSAVLWVLHHELRAYRLTDVIAAVHKIPPGGLLLALLFTILSYLIMTGYDRLALRYLQHPLAYGRIATASFVGYAFSNNIGLSMIAGASVRFHLYSAWGLSALEISKVVTLCSITFWMGFAALAGIVFLFDPVAVPESLPGPLSSLPLLGAVFLVVVALYLAISLLRRKPLVVRDWTVPVPSISIALSQVGLGMLDWLVAAMVLFVLFPPIQGLTLPGFLGIYLVAQMAGITSQIPGGLGVFETVILLFCSPFIAASDILGTLLVFRGIYYLLPLTVATVLLGTRELFQRKQDAIWISEFFGQWAPLVVPRILTVMTFVAGAILLFSGATPAVETRLAVLKHMLPLPVIEVSHFFGSLIGAGLLILARGLWRRIDAAYFLTGILLGAGVLFSLLKGFDYEEAFVLSALLLGLLPCRRYFYRKASIISHRFSLGWMTALLIVFSCTLWLVIFSFKHVNYSHDLWWHFTLYGDAPRSLRALTGAAVLTVIFVLAKLLTPMAKESSYPTAEEFDLVAAVVGASHRAYANLALMGDKRFLFSQSKNAFIMYGIEGRSWIALGDPIGPPEEWPELAWRFREKSDQYGGWTVFYEVSTDYLPLYLDLGLTLLNLGEEALVDLASFTLEGRKHRDMRHTKNKLEKEGCTFEVISPEEGVALLPDIKGISDAWLTGKNTAEKRFSLGFFTEDYVKRFSLGIVRQEGTIVAFTNILKGAEKEELSIDLMRYHPEAPRDVMEYLFIHLMLYGKEEGYRWFNLGMAPLSGMEDHELAPFWHRAGSFVFRHGEHFYNFQGLRQYKEKFDPLWKPKYLACPGGVALFRVIANLSSLVSGGLRGVILK